MSCDNNQPLSGSTAPQHAKTGSVPEVVVYNNPQDSQLRYPTRCCKSFLALRDSSSQWSRIQSQRGTSIIITSSSHTRRLRIISTLFARNSPARIFTGLQEALLVCHFDNLEVLSPWYLVHSGAGQAEINPTGLRFLSAEHHIRMKGTIRFFFCFSPSTHALSRRLNGSRFEIPFCAQISLSLSKHSIYPNSDPPRRST